MRLFLILFFLFLVPCQAMSEIPTIQELDKLIEQIENPDKKNKLVKTLRTLRHTMEKKEARPHVIETGTSWAVHYIEVFIQSFLLSAQDITLFFQEVVQKIPALTNNMLQEKLALSIALLIFVYLLLCRSRWRDSIFGFFGILATYMAHRYLHTVNHLVFFVKQTVIPLIIFGGIMNVRYLLPKATPRFWKENHQLSTMIIGNVRFFLLVMALCYGALSLVWSVVGLPPQGQDHWMSLSFLIMSLTTLLILNNYRGIAREYIESLFAPSRSTLVGRFTEAVALKWYPLTFLLFIFLNFGTFFIGKSVLFQKVSLSALFLIGIGVFWWFKKEMVSPKTYAGQFFYHNYQQLKAHPFGKHFIPLLSLLIQLSFWSLMIYLFLKLSNVNLSQFFHNVYFDFLLIKTLSLYVLIFILRIGWHTIDLFDQWMRSRTQDSSDYHYRLFSRTIFPLIKRFLKVGLVTIGIISCLSVFGIAVMPILYSLSVVGFTVGFGAQNLIRDLISGLMTILEGTLVVGDFVRIGQYSGTVESISLRNLKLRHNNGHLQTIPFSEASNIINLSRDYAMIPLEIVVWYDTTLKDVYQLFQDVLDQMKNDPRWSSFILGTLSISGVTTLTERGVLVSASVKTLPDPQNRFTKSFNALVQEKMKDYPITVPTEYVSFYKSLG